ncbi:MAG: hypothetical protein NTZ33_00365 [Bacteroidetes bacterium]|nr:hypothetical protein [Bacteroidota bacterium]
MKKTTLLIFLICFHFSLFAQIRTQNDSIKPHKFKGFVSLLTDVTINEQQHFSTVGMGGAYFFGNSMFIGCYGLGLVSPIHLSDILSDNTFNDYHVNYAHGGLWLGYIDYPSRLIHVNFTLKIGWGAIFLDDINKTINYNYKRSEFLVITPQYELEVMVTNWLRLDFGLGIRFISGMKLNYTDANGINRNLYNSSDFEGLIASFALKLGKINNSR